MNIRNLSRSELIGVLWGFLTFGTWSLGAPTGALQGESKEDPSRKSQDYSKYRVSRQDSELLDIVSKKIVRTKIEPSSLEQKCAEAVFDYEREKYAVETLRYKGLVWPSAEYYGLAELTKSYNATYRYKEHNKVGDYARLAEGEILTLLGHGFWPFPPAMPYRLVREEEADSPAFLPEESGQDNFSLGDVELPEGQ